jgi:hypothetical protein
MGPGKTRSLYLWYKIKNYEWYFNLRFSRQKSKINRNV